MTAASASATVSSRRGIPVTRRPRPQLRIQLGQGLQGKPPLRQPRVRDHEAGLVDADALDGQDVEIDQARTEPLSVRIATESPLDRLQLGQQRPRLQVGLENQRGIQEVRLIGPLSRSRPIHARDLDRRADPGDGSHSRLQRVPRLIEVAAESEQRSE